MPLRSSRQCRGSEVVPPAIPPLEPTRPLAFERRRLPWPVPEVTEPLPPFKDRREAGRELADRLQAMVWPVRPVVLALPRGGVPVAAEVAQRLGAPLDVLVVRKIGVPGQCELAAAAVAEGRPPLVLVRGMGLLPAQALPPDVAAQLPQATAELDRRVRAYRQGRELRSLAGLPVVLVDDGLATGTTMRAAVAAARARMAREVIVAVPVGGSTAVAEMRRVADRVVCLRQPLELWSIGEHYQDFHQLDDDEVAAALGRGASPC